MFAAAVGTEDEALVSHLGDCCENATCERCSDTNRPDEVEALVFACKTITDIEQLTNFALAAVRDVRIAAVRRLAELAQFKSDDFVCSNCGVGFVE